MAEARTTYDENRAEYERRYTEWMTGGGVGEAPPRPVPPHTPGFRGPVSDVELIRRGVREDEEAAERVRAAAPQLLDSLLAIEWSGFIEDDDDAVECCPNCFAPIGDAEIEGSGVHYAHCELRDSLDAALGVTSQRRIHPAHEAGAAR